MIQPQEHSPPPYKQYDYSQFEHSPRTITLRNQSDTILRSMTHEHTAMMLTAQRDQLFLNAPIRPFLPSIGGGTTKSSPIRITRRKQLQPRYAPRAHRPEDDDAHLSASPTELQHFYDEATWRMYHLIQAARSEKQQQTKTTAALGTDESSYDAFFATLPHRAPASLLPSAGRSAVAPEEDLMVTLADNDDCVFELDDF